MNPSPAAPSRSDTHPPLLAGEGPRRRRGAGGGAAKRMAASIPVLPLLVVALAFAARVALVLKFPIMPLGDSYGRLLHSPQLVQGVWLPGYQLPMALLTLFTRDLTAHRLLNAFEGALACGGAALFFGRALGRWAGAFAGALVAISPVFLQSSMGLYQEGLFVALTTFGLGLVLPARGPGAPGPGAEGAAISGGWGIAAGLALLGAAELTRYEGWFVGALLAGGIAYSALRGQPLPGLAGRRAALAVAALALGPLGWLLVNGGLSPLGTRSLSPEVGVDRVVDQLGYLVALVPAWIGWPLVGAAALGIPLALRDRRGRGLALGALAFAALDFALLAFARPYAPPDNWRQMHLPLLLALLFAAHLLGALGGAVGARLRDIPPLAWAAAGRLGLCAATIALLPPWKMIESAPRWFGQGTVAVAAHMGEALRPTLAGGGRLLILGGGGADYEAGECQAAAVFAQLPRDRVVCTHELGEAPGGAPGLARWLAEEDIVAIGWLAGFADLTPAHRAFKAWRDDEPPWAARLTLSRGNRSYAVDQAALRAWIAAQP